MSLRVQQLNADTTFLLTFSPPFAPEISKRYPGDYIILIDPWLQGQSSILHPTFQVSNHTYTPALYSLAELNQKPDLIIVSQDKPDHCHRETLCSLPRDTDITILATPAAVKKIKSWNYFDDEIVHAIFPYDSNDEDSVIRLALPGPSSFSGDGEITIANIPTKRDMAGVHNAIGLTYQPASTVLTVQQRSETSMANGWSAVALPERNAISAPASRQRSSGISNGENASLYPGTMSDPAMSRIPSLHPSFSSSGSLGKERVLSLIYTPHGVSPQTIAPYINSHLNELNALPVSALFHSVNVEKNPRFMGGVVAAGAPGGVDLVKSIGVKYWIGAHDEPKNNHGMATVLLKTQSFDIEEVEELLDEAGVKGTKVYQLDVGEVLRIPELKKTVESARRTRRPVRRGLRMKTGQRMNVEDNVLAMPEPKGHKSGAGIENGAVAPGTKVRIRREITDPEGRWI